MEIYKASLKIFAKFSGLRQVLFCIASMGWLYTCVIIWQALVGIAGYHMLRTQVWSQQRDIPLFGLKELKWNNFVNDWWYFLNFAGLLTNPVLRFVLLEFLVMPTVRHALAWFSHPDSVQGWLLHWYFVCFILTQLSKTLFRVNYPERLSTGTDGQWDDRPTWVYLENGPGY